VISNLRSFPVTPTETGENSGHETVPSYGKANKFNSVFTENRKEEKGTKRMKK